MKREKGKNGLNFKDYIKAIQNTAKRETLNKIIYYSGFNSNLNESEVKAIIILAETKLKAIQEAYKAEQLRRNNRSIAKIQA